MYPNPIPVSDGTSTINFDYKGSSEDQSKYQVNDSTNLDQPHSITIKHTKTQVNSVNQTRRTLVRFDKVVEDGQGNQGTLSAYLVVVIPEKITDVDTVGAEINLMKNFLAASGYITKIVNAEI